MSNVTFFYYFNLTSKTTAHNASFNKSYYKIVTRPWDFGDISLLVLLIIGTIGNILSIFVIKRKGIKHNNTSLLIICISISDILFLMTKFTSNMVKIYRIQLEHLCVFIQIISSCAFFISIWLIVLASFERAIAVVLPLSVNKIFSRTKSINFILSINLFFIFISISISLCIESLPGKTYYCKIKGNETGKCYFYYNYVFPLIRSVLGSWIPGIILFVLNILIIFSLYRSSKFRKNCYYKYKMNKIESQQYQSILSIHVFGKKKDLNYKSIVETSHEKILKIDMKKRLHQKPKERQITIMLLSISISFFVLTFPYATYEILRKFDFDFKFLKNRLFLRACMFLIDLNHASNFIFYCLMVQKFREELIKIVACYLFFNREAAYLKSAQTSSYYTNHMVILNKEAN